MGGRQPFRMIILPLCWETMHYFMFVSNRQIPVKNEKHSTWTEKLSGGSSSSSLQRILFCTQNSKMTYSDPHPGIIPSFECEPSLWI